MLKALIYKLKRQFPTTLTVVRKSAESYNVQTGRKTNTIEAWLIKRAVKCPAKFLGEVAGTNGLNLFDIIVIIDLSDLPSGFIFGPTDYVEISNLRYNVKKILEHYLTKEIVLLQLAAIEGSRATIQVCNSISNLNLESINE